MDPYQAALANNQLDRDLAMTILMNNAASDAFKMSRLGQQQQSLSLSQSQQRQQQLQSQLQQQLQQQQQSQQQGAGAGGGAGGQLTQQQQLLQSAYSSLSAGNGGGSATAAASAAQYQQDMLRLQSDLLHREMAVRAGLPGLNMNRRASGGGAMNMNAAMNMHEHQSLLLRAAALNPSMASAAQHPSFTSLLNSIPGVGGGAAAMAAGLGANMSPPSSPTSNKPAASIVTAETGGLKRAAGAHRDSVGSSLSSATDGSQNDANKKPRLATAVSAGSMTGDGGMFSPVSPGGSQQQQQQHRGAKAKLRDDFWGKVGKNNSHIHLVNIVLGRLLFEQVKTNYSKGGNKVLSNDLIQQILQNKLYGKYAVREFFASGNKASETVRNTWTRLNFASDNIRKGLSRYKEQTWQAIERCPFDDVPEADQEEMDEALKVFASTGRFVPALNIALKGIITEQFMGVLMQLRLEWNNLCLNCRPEEHDMIVSAFLRKYGLNGK